MIVVLTLSVSTFSLLAATLAAAQWLAAEDLLPMSIMPLPAAVGFVATSGLLGANEVLTPWQGVVVVGAYALLALIGGAVSLRRRDV